MLHAQDACDFWNVRPFLPLEPGMVTPAPRIPAPSDALEAPPAVSLDASDGGASEWGYEAADPSLLLTQWGDGIAFEDR